VGFISIKFSGSIAVIKTRNGYAAGLAYDIDMSHSSEVLGTIAGADTVFAIMREDLSHEEALKFFSRFIPVHEQH
jgi:transcriptional regulator of arginine metabolism